MVLASAHRKAKYRKRFLDRRGHRGIVHQHRAGPAPQLDHGEFG
ncbi:MAG: hypothetical protein ACT4QG_04755 [Sporichthyaceae bacterium]